MEARASCSGAFISSFLLLRSSSAMACGAKVQAMPPSGVINSEGYFRQNTNNLLSTVTLEQKLPL